MEQFSEIRRQSALADLQSANWLRHVVWQAEVDSTNNLAKQWFIANPNDVPALFVADQQTAGRGRSGNQWWSPSGCLMMSLVIPSTELTADLALHPQLALVVGVAVAKAVDKLLDNPSPGNDSVASGALISQLKWPNDVYIHGKKIAGILIETVQSRSSSSAASIGFAIGVGINAQINWQDAPVQLLERATCLSSASKRPIYCEEVLLEVIENLQSQLSNWQADARSWFHDWQERCLLTDRIVHVRSAESGEVTGLCQGIDSQGRLLLRTENQTYSLNACEILSWS